MAGKQWKKQEIQFLKDNYPNILKEYQDSQ